MGINVTGNNIDPLQTTMTTVEYARDGSWGFIAGWGQEGINHGIVIMAYAVMTHRDRVVFNRVYGRNRPPLTVPDVNIAWRNDRHPWNNR